MSFPVVALTRKNAQTSRKKTQKAKRATADKKIVKPTKPLTNAVNQIVNRRTETKFVIGAPTNKNSAGNLGAFTAFTSGITSTNEVYALIPFVAQGTKDNERTGAVIQPVSLTTKVNLSLFTAASMAVYADVYFCTSKNVKDYDLTNQIPTGELLNKGDDTNVAYDGTSATAMYPVNKSEFTVIGHKRVRLAKGADDPNTALSGGSPPSTDTFNYYASFSQKVPLPAKLTYETSAKQQPSNTFPFMMVGFVGADANGNTAPTSARVFVQAQSHLYFKDF